MQKTVGSLLFFAILLFASSACKASWTDENQRITLKQSYAIPFAARGTSFYSKRPAQDDYSKFFIKGMNIGQTLPDTSLMNPSIPFETYQSWLKMIHEMNINTIKVFSVMDASFYRALAEHNAANPNTPLYLMQGIWVNGGDYSMLRNAYSQDRWLTTAYLEAVQKAVDVVHGNYEAKKPNQKYTHDVSEYTIGYIIGSEWDPSMIQATNALLDAPDSFSGDYLYTENAQIFEAFLCEIGEGLIAHETQSYDTQHPIAFLSWAPTDPLSHPDEPIPYDNMVRLNTEAIKPTDQYEAGLFAAMDVYPYYPEFMNFQRDYIAGDEGEINSFAAYLADLKAYHTVPLVVAEFGLSTARGRAHESAMGYHQGMLNETQQGEYVLAMMQDIHRLNLAGGFIFIWQDEWFKQTWNTARVAASGARYLNVQSAEQRYGIAAYEPGSTAPICLPDGKDDEWRGISPTVVTDDFSLSFQRDEAYLYLLLRSNDKKDLRTIPCAVALGTTDGRGNTTSQAHGLSFEQPADFLLLLSGETQTRLLTAAGSDLAHWLKTRPLGYEPPDATYEQQDNGLFAPIQMQVSGPLKVPYEAEKRVPVAYEAGLLHYGNANPKSKNYDSLADYCFGADFVELRLPWYLLNILDPATPMRAADFFADESGALTLEPISHISAGLVRLDGQQRNIPMKGWQLTGYRRTSYHLRLKDSYWILQDGLKSLGNRP